MEISPKHRMALAAFYRATDYMLKESPELPASVLKTFLGVIIWADRPADQEPMTVLELADHLRLPGSTVSRHLRYLGVKERTGVEGMGLVTLHEYIHDRRHKTVHLTESGKRVAKRLIVKTSKGLTP